MGCKKPNNCGCELFAENAIWMGLCGLLSFRPSSRVFDPCWARLGITPEERQLHLYRLSVAGRHEAGPELSGSVADEWIAHLCTFRVGRGVGLATSVRDSANRWKSRAQPR